MCLPQNEPVLMAGNMLVMHVAQHPAAIALPNCRCPHHINTVHDLHPSVSKCKTSASIVYAGRCLVFQGGTNPRHKHPPSDHHW